MVIFSHSVWREAEQIHLLLPGPSSLFRPERGRSQVFERTAGPDLWKEKPGRQVLEYFALAHVLHAAFGWLAGGKRWKQPPQNLLSLGKLRSRWQVSSTDGPGLALVTLSHTAHWGSQAQVATCRLPLASVLGENKVNIHSTALLLQTALCL